MENPFKYGGVVTGEYFADREEESDELVREAANLNRIFLISPRRYGKTCLLFHVLERLREDGYATAFIDLNAHPDLVSFAVAYTQATSGALESSGEKLMKIFAGLRRLRPKVSVGTEGNITAGLEFAADRKEALPTLLDGMRHADELAGSKGKKLVVAVDEFSDLAKYNGQTIEKAMRSEIQRQTHLAYIFSGSEQSVMLDMTRDRKRAFYKLGRLMELGPIKREPYAAFIFKWLKKGGYEVKKKDLSRIFELGRDVPYNIQRICHTLWEAARDKKAISPEQIEEVPDIIARQDTPHFELLWYSASPQQKMLLMALSEEPDARPFSREFQVKYSIGPSSSIKASLESLIKKGILFRDRQGTYQFSDTFMHYWIRQMG